MAKQFSVFVNIGGKVSPSFGQAVTTVENRLNSLSRRFRSAASESAKAMKGMSESAKALAGLAAGGGLAFSMKHALGEGADLAHELQALRNAGRTAHEVADGLAEANKVIAALPTATLENGIKLLNETTGAYGDFHHAVENLEFNAKLGDVLKNTIGDSVGDPGKALGSLVKALEIRGTASNPETYRKEAGEIARAMIFSGGRVTPDEFLTFARRANPAIKFLNERFLTKIAPSLIQELGGEGAGTGLTAFRKVIKGGITDSIQAKAWVDLGMVDPKQVRHNKAGQVQGWTSGAVKGTDQAFADPLQWMETEVLPRLQKQGTDISDPIALAKKLDVLFKNTKSNAFANAMAQAVDRARWHKDEGLINKVLTIDDNYDESLLNDPKLAQHAMASAMKNIGSALTLPMMKPIAQGLVAIARALNKVSAALIANPQAAKIIAGIAAALAAMAAVRLASFVFGLAGLGRALMFLSLALPFTLAGRLIAVARGITVIAAASALGVAGRLRALAAGIIALGAVGGVRGALAVVGGALLGLARAVLLFPFTVLRLGFAGLVALITPVGVAVAAIVAALAALGLWVYNNLAGIGTFFTTFGESFMKALGPEASKNVETVVGHLKTAWTWINSLLGPLDETGAKWKAWGEWAGQGAAAVVTALTGLPEKIGALARQGYEALTSFDWGAAGKAIVDGIAAGIARGAGALADALKGAVSSAWEAAKGAIGLGGGSSAGAAPGAPAIAGRRALGGPVTGGRPYLVGENGPEIFVPNTTGRIETNGVLNSLSRAGGRATGAKGLTVGVDASAVEEAGETAKKAGAQLHASLDATTRPIIDTTSIDAATASAEKLRAVLATVRASSISLGGGGGGGGGAAAAGAKAGNGAAPAAASARGGGGKGSADGAKITGPIANAPTEGVRAEVRDYLRTAAATRGIDPNVAERVMRQESGFNPNARNVNAREASFGVFQLNTKGGLGNVAERQGINPRDPSHTNLH